MDYTSRLNNLLQSLKLCQRNRSDQAIFDMFGINKKEYRLNKESFVLNIRNVIKLLKDKKGKLLLDYTLIGQDMKVIDKPYNMVYNYVKGCFEPCLVILFAIIVIEDEVFPVGVDFWISKDMLEADENYETKTEIAKKMIRKLVDKGMVIETALFDAGFNTPDFLKFLTTKNIHYIARVSKSKKMDNKQTIKELFSDELNGNFYYYHTKGFCKYKDIIYANRLSRLIVVCNTKQKLVDREYYCILSSNLDIKYTQVIKLYKERFKIEVFFRNLKSYIGLSSSRRHHIDKISNHINFCCAMYLLVQYISKKKKLTFYKSLLWIKTTAISIVFRLVENYWKKISKIYEFTSIELAMIEQRFTLLAS